MKMEFREMLMKIAWNIKSKKSPAIKSLFNLILWKKKFHDWRKLKSVAISLTVVKLLQLKTQVYFEREEKIRGSFPSRYLNSS